MRPRRGTTEAQALHTRPALAHALFVVSAVALAGCTAGSNGQDTTWKQIAVDHLDDFVTEHEDDAVAAQAFGQSFYASGVLNGWDHATTERLLDAVYRSQNPDGGYGLGERNDSYSNDEVNPADTTYLVTAAFHVGLPLLDGHEAGIVPDSRVQEIVDLAAEAPLRDDCVPYSLHENDLDEPCVHNVNAAVAWFLTEAEDAGFGHPDLVDQRARVTARLVREYLPDERNWLYRDGKDRMSDPGHTHVKLAAVRRLAPPIWEHAAPAFVDIDPAEVEPRDVLGYLRALPHGLCEEADQWLDRAHDTVGANTSARRVASLAASAARIHENCGVP